MENRYKFFNQNLPIGTNMFCFKLLKNIKATKYEKFFIGDSKLFKDEHQSSDYKRLVEQSFKYKGYSIPRTMDLTL